MALASLILIAVVVGVTIGALILLAKVGQPDRRRRQPPSQRR